MTALRSLVLAYNDVALAASDEALQFGQYSLSQGDEELRLGVSFAVFGSGTPAAAALDLAAKVRALDALRVPNGTLVVQQARELELDDLVSGGGTTLTSATGGFLATHAGDWLVIQGVGSRRIVSAGGGSATVHAAVPAGTYRAIKPARLFRGTHDTFTFMNGTAAFAKQAGSELNTEYSQAFTLDVSGDLPARGAGCLKSLKVDIAFDASRRRTATINGTYRACDHDGDGVVSSAKDVHDAEITTLVTNHLSGFGGIAVYELTSQSEDYDAREAPALYAGGADVQKTYSFRRTYHERFVADHAAIIEQNLSVTMNQGSTHHQLPGATGLVTATVSYSCNVDHDIITEAGLRSLYVGTIRGLIGTAILNATGSGRSKQVIEAESYTPNQSANTINASWTVILADRTSRVIALSVVTTVTRDIGVVAVELWDQIDDTYAIWKRKGTMGRSTITTVRSQEPVQFTSNGDFVRPGQKAMGLNLGIDLAMPFGDLSKLQITWPGQKTTQGFWMQNGNETVQRSQEDVGQTALGSPFGKMTIHSATLTRNDLWVVPAKRITPRFTPDTYSAFSKKSE